MNAADREARVTALLNHHAIVQGLDFGWTDGRGMTIYRRSRQELSFNELTAETAYRALQTDNLAASRIRGP